MRNYISKKISLKGVVLTLSCLLILVAIVPQITHADGDSLVAGFFWQLVNLLFGWMVFVSGKLLDYSVNRMVVGFGQLYAENGLGLTIDTLWVTVRDIFNLTFIFGLVFIGLRMIFGSDSNTKKMLVSIILAALLVNFSLFITKFVVDFSNIAATQIVNQAFKIDPSTNKPSISATFMAQMGITSIWSNNADLNKTAGTGTLGYIFGMMFIFIITSFVFFAGSFLLIIRFVVLNIYLVLSPIMFIGWVFPSMAKYSSEYWSGFLSRCFVAPAYILMLYFTQKVLTSFALAPGSRGSLSDLWSDKAPASFEQVFPPLVLTAVFLIASIVVAQKMSATGGSAIISMQDKLMKKTRGAVQGTAFAMTKPFRAAGQAGGKKAASIVGSAATQQINTWQAKAHAQGSAVGASRWAKAVGWAATSNGVDKAARGATAWVTNAEFGSGTSQKADDEYKQKTKNRAEERAKVMAGTDPTNVSELARLRQQDKDSKATPPTAAALTTAEITELGRLEKIEKEMQSAVADMAISNLEAMSAKELEKIAKYLTSSQTEKVMGSDKISSETKAKIGKARYDAIENVVGTAGSVLSAELTKLSIEQIESMGDSWINDNAHLFSNTQMDDLKKSKKFTESQKNNFVADRAGWHQAAVAHTTFKGKTTDIAQLFEHTAGGGDRKAVDIANLGSKVLLHPDSLWFITADVLEAIADKKTLTSAEKATLKTNLLATPGPYGAAINDYFTKSPHGLRYW